MQKPRNGRSVFSSSHLRSPDNKANCSNYLIEAFGAFGYDANLVESCHSAGRSIGPGPFTKQGGLDSAPDATPRRFATAA